MFLPKPCVRDKQKQLSNNNIKWGKLFIGYSKMNRITNYTTGKYCKLINCLAWWRWMSPTAPVVPFSNLLATIFFKKLKKNHECGVTGVFYVVELYRESILSLCEPRTLFKGFHQNTIQKTRWLWDDGTGSAKMLTRFWVLRTYIYVIKTCQGSRIQGSGFTCVLAPLSGHFSLKLRRNVQ